MKIFYIEFNLFSGRFFIKHNNRHTLKTSLQIKSQNQVIYKYVKMTNSLLKLLLNLSVANMLQ